MRATSMMTAATAVLAAGLVAAPVVAGPREALAAAAFTAPTPAAALTQVNAVQAAADAILAKDPANRDAQIYHAMAIGYRAKLTKSRAGALEAHALFEKLAAADPHDPQTQALVGGWHLDAIDSLGGFMAKTVLGAKRELGLAAIDRAAALGGSQATYPALAAMMRIRLDPADLATSRGLAEAAGRAPAPSPLDRLLQRDAAALLVPLRAGDGKTAATLARRMLPFGRIL